MLRMRVIGASAVVLIAAAGAAIAADVSRYEAPPAPPPYTPVAAYSWTGPYAGLIGGYSWDSGNVGNGWLGGAFAGYNFQMLPNWVAGIEGDFTFTGKSSGTFSNPWNSTLRGRLGYAYDRFLFYGTGGVAFGDLKNTAVGGEAVKVGWTAGLGVEAALTNNVTGRIEWRHTDLGAASFATPATSTSNDLMIGVGVKF